jgi:hypothetical protein
MLAARNSSTDWPCNSSMHLPRSARERRGRYGRPMLLAPANKTVINRQLNQRGIKMNIPGFTAEASLYNGNTRYRATAEDSFYGDLVQPAGSGVLSDPYGSSAPFLSTQLFFPDHPVWCLTQECAIKYPDSRVCRVWRWTVGVLNPVTGHCD